MYPNLRLPIKILLMVGLLFGSFWSHGCRKSDAPRETSGESPTNMNGSQSYAGQSEHKSARTGAISRDYFPLAIGNSWTYKCTIPPGSEPLFSFLAEIEKPHQSRGHRKGDRIWNYGRCSNAQSGIEKYVISGYDNTHDAFRVTSSEGAIDDRKYSLQELVDLYWLYNDYGVWEVARARDLGETILVSGFIAYLEAGAGQEEISERRRKVECEYIDGRIDVPAGKFSGCLRNVTTQLGGTDLKEIKTVSYFAKNVGLLKEIQYDSRGVETYTLELIEFHIE